MVNLALYSDQIVPANSMMDIRLLRMMRSQGLGTRIGYIPSGPEPGRRFFNERRAYYGQYGLHLSVFHDLDDPHSPEETDELFACDAIHLSGGQTGGFLERLKHSGMLDRLANWALSGGILIGTSAGAILMTPTIAADALFSGNRPEDVKDGVALNLTPFEFFPHLGADPSYLSNLTRYSRHTPRPIIACHDGDGVVVTRGVVECIGHPLWIAEGAVIQIKEIALADIVVSLTP